MIELGDISYNIISISCVGIMSIYHQKRDMISNDITWREKKDDISIYHVSTRNMIYHDTEDDTQ